MNNIVIRKATTLDVPDMVPLMEQLGYPVQESELRSRIQKFIQNPGYWVAVSCIDEQICGLIAWSKSSLFVLDKTRFHVEAIVVSNEFRGWGIGKQLMLYLEKFAADYSPVIIDLTSGLRRAGEGTNDFYKKLGYKNEGHMAKLYLRKEL
jgi:ribosomal protein S18 acetylase RimI-like enzyme